MLSRWLRKRAGRLLGPLLLALARCGATPNLITLCSLAVVVAAAGLVALGHPVVGGWLLLVGGLLDALDGGLARLVGRDSEFGAFLDSVSDHLGDFALYLGLLALTLKTGTPHPFLILAALFGSLFGSLVRSRAALLGVDTGEIGAGTRCERILIAFSGLVTGGVGWALWLLALLNNISALQRLVHVLLAVRLRQETGLADE